MSAGLSSALKASDRAAEVAKLFGEQRGMLPAPAPALACSLQAGSCRMASAVHACMHARALWCGSCLQLLIVLLLVLL